MIVRIHRVPTTRRACFIWRLRPRTWSMSSRLPCQPVTYLLGSAVMASTVRYTKSAVRWHHPACPLVNLHTRSVCRSLASEHACQLVYSGWL